MINPTHIDTIVRRTLNDIGETNPVYVRLIKGTFLYESNLQDLFDHSNQYMKFHGLSLMSDKRIKEVVTQYLRYRNHSKKSLQAVTGVSIDTDPLQKISDAMEVDISLMVAMTYYYYQYKRVPVPKDDLVEIAQCYRDNYYIGEYQPELVNDFVDYYKEVYSAH